MNHTWLLDEYLLRSNAFLNLRIVNLERKEELVKASPRDGANAGKRVHFHPHCHQRAEGLSEDGLPIGTGATVELLRSCGFEVELLDTGCCGMAGTFGYEAEHYALSMKVGELKLFPLLRTPSQPPPNPEPEFLLTGKISLSDLGEVPAEGRAEGVLSSGAACRMQIRQGTGVEAVHPIVFVAQFLKETEDVEQ
jgi:Fe-S oxidoreductase